MLASSLIAGGMDWKQALFTILMGNLIVLVPMLLNAHAGAKYGIPFPVFVRASFGALGANIPAMLRALVACGWFGIQSWLGGQAIAAMIHIVWPATEHMPVVLWSSFPRLLAAQHVRRVVRGGVDPLPAELLRALHAGDVAAAALLDAAQGRRFWTHAFGAQPLPLDRQLSPFLLSVVDGDGWLLGYALAEHPRLHPLCQVAGLADCRPGLWSAGGDDVSTRSSASRAPQPRRKSLASPYGPPSRCWDAFISRWRRCWRWSPCWWRR